MAGMKIANDKFKTQCLLLILLLLIAGYGVAAELRFPRPKGAVNDFAGVIDGSYVRKMEALSREVLEKTGTSIVVAVVESIGDQDPGDYANRLYEAWGIGKKGEDKGVLIFLALRERRIRIETGYGVEGILPDGRVGEILDAYVVPFLRKGEYGKGLANGVAALASVIAKDAEVSLSGEPERPRPREAVNRRGTKNIPLLLLIPFIFLLLGTRRGREMLPFLLIMLMGSSRGGRGGRRDGGFGGGFGGFGGGMSGGGGAGRSF